MITEVRAFDGQRSEPSFYQDTTTVLLAPSENNIFDPPLSQDPLTGTVLDMYMDRDTLPRGISFHSNSPTVKLCEGEEPINLSTSPVSFGSSTSPISQSSHGIGSSSHSSTFSSSLFLPSHISSLLDQSPLSQSNEFDSPEARNYISFPTAAPFPGEYLTPSLTQFQPGLGTLHPDFDSSLPNPSVFPKIFGAGDMNPDIFPLTPPEFKSEELPKPNVDKVYSPPTVISFPDKDSSLQPLSFLGYKPLVFSSPPETSPIQFPHPPKDPLPPPINTLPPELHIEYPQSLPQPRPTASVQNIVTPPSAHNTKVDMFNVQPKVKQQAPIYQPASLVVFQPAPKISQPQLLSLPFSIRNLLNQKNQDLLPYYLDLFPTMSSSSTYLGAFKHSVSIDRQTGWIACTTFPDNVFCDLRKINRLQRSFCKPGALVKFKIVLNVKSQSYFSAEQPYLVNDTDQYLTQPQNPKL
ncbi:hypothetical protein BLNAU_4735 [Blattamonas nauphoetae]|uniref:Uncharacterized protein n=1 Tax=Blattamonas nauphoetae TaxID=2049346 RepID=A0ABQ9Y8U4_9EUKA|nr:hypothetical protein BLNAU_4735 [Blattamonas nauphoetae]